MIADFYVAQGSLSPSVQDVLLDENKAPLDVTGMDSVVFRMRLLDRSRPAITGTAVVIDPTGADATLKGAVRYDWLAGQTEVPGLYQVEWLTSTAGAPETIANNVKSTLWIAPRV